MDFQNVRLHIVRLGVARGDQSNQSNRMAGEREGRKTIGISKGTGLIPTLEKKCVGRWCVARSPFDMCPLACITSVRENTNQYRILRNKSPSQQGCFISLELKSRLFRFFFVKIIVDKSCLFNIKTASA